MIPVILPHTEFTGSGATKVQLSCIGTDAVILEDTLGAMLIPDELEVIVELGAPDEELDVEVT